MLVGVTTIAADVAVAQEEEKLIPQKRMQLPTVEHAPVPQFLEETVEEVEFCSP